MTARAGPRLTLAAAGLLLLACAACLVSAAQPRRIRVAEGRSAVAYRDRELLPRAWRQGSRAHATDRVRFSIHLNACNLKALDTTFWAVSDPDSLAYGNHVSRDDMYAMLRCPNHDDGVAQVRAWLQEAGVSAEAIAVQPLFIRVETDAQTAERLFRTPFHELHHRSGVKLVRAMGTVTVPAAVAEHVNLVTGITELFHSKLLPRRVHHYGSRRDSDPVYLPASDPIISPQVLRRLYSMRPNLVGTSPVNQLGIAAFDDYFYEDDLCAAQVMLGRDIGTSPVDYLQSPKVRWIGPTGGGDDVESSLDIQYGTFMATGVPALFSNHDPDEWILDWAQQTIHNTDKNGPWVWSISYGWPEISECTTVGQMGEACSDLGYDYHKYINATNTAIQSLGAMGVSVLVSDGDDGAPSFGAQCPIDARFPVGDGVACPFEDVNDCRCGTLVFTLTNRTASSNRTCIAPLGPMLSDGGAPTPVGTDCDFLETDDSCNFVLDQLVNMSNSSSAENGYCLYSFNQDTMILFSNCTCEHVVPIVGPESEDGTTCSVAGYKYDPKWGSAFTPDYPTASPFVTSVGATMVIPVVDSPCGEVPELLSDVAKAEMPVQKVAGAFDSGGGFSQVSPQPEYQKSFVNAYLSKGLAPPSYMFDRTKRGYPDIALNGHNYLVMAEHELQPVGGTSASSPALAGMLTLINDVLLRETGKTLGFLNPLLYKMAAEHPAAFQKIRPYTFTNISGLMPGFETYTAGSNNCSRMACCEYGYKSSDDGWDPVSGLGTPNMLEIENYVRKLHSLPAVGSTAVCSGQTSPAKHHDKSDTGKLVDVAVATFFVGVLLAFVLARVAGVCNKSQSGNTINDGAASFGYQSIH